MFADVNLKSTYRDKECLKAVQLDGNNIEVESSL